MECNIDARGKAVRLIWGLTILLTAALLAALHLLGVLASGAWWIAVGVLGAFGGFGVFEARAGWCVVRAMGFKTRI